MNIIYYLSDGIIPFTFIIIVGYALLNKVDVFDAFIDGALSGFQTVIKILPTLIGLMAAVGILRTSGCLDYISSFISPVTDLFEFPSELVPLVIIKMFSSSAASSLLVDIYKQSGPDSSVGILASVLMSCSETIFYTMSVYFMTAGVTKTRYTLAGSVACMIAGIIASVFIVGIS
ncbi:MAG: spore maturation protein [Lachnospiraceae bacterium]|nr:spore maturation protein [Lachnospiraceae bacterium]